MKKSPFMALALLAALGACSTRQHLLAPDPEADHILSPERSNVIADPPVDPVCGGLLGGSDRVWHSTWRDIGYSFDCSECKARFDANPDYFASR